MNRLKRYFIAGLAVVLPVAVTLWILFVVFGFIDNLAGSILAFVTGGRVVDIPGLGIAATIAVIIAAGILATNIIGKRLLAYGERMLMMVPLANSVYRVAKQVFEAFSKNNKETFRQVGMVEWPRKGLWSICFVVGESEIGHLTPETPDNYRVFIPTVPNPTTGFMFLVPQSDVVILPISVEEGVKFVLSVGIATPEGMTNPAATATKEA